MECLRLLFRGSTLVPYEVAHSYQLELVELRARDEIKDTFLLVEHPAVITRGKGLQGASKNGGPRSLPVSSSCPLPIVDIERGGDLTAHEPGQWVLYPIVKLGDKNGYCPDRDIDRYLRQIERDVIRCLAEFGIRGHVTAGATGIWCTHEGRERKIASLGIAVRRWVTYHGLALNVWNDLSSFDWMNPCGFESTTMVNLAKMMGDRAPIAWTEPQNDPTSRWKLLDQAWLAQLNRPGFSGGLSYKDLARNL